MRSSLVAITTILLLGFITGQQDCLAYKSVTYYSGSYAAVGDGSSIDLFNSEGELLKTVELPEGTVVNCIESFDGVLVAAGEKYLAVYDGINLIGSEVLGDVAAMAEFQGNLLVAVNTQGGAQLLSFESTEAEPQIIALSLKGSFVDLSASEQACCGVTDTGEIVWTYDGLSWTVTDFNAVYAGFYPEVELTCAGASPNNSIAVAGRTASGSSVMFTSSGGNVWSERELSRLEGGSPVALEEQVLGLAYDRFADQYICLCSGGALFLVPACSHCNALRKVNANELYDLELIGTGSFFVVGADGFRAVVQR